MSAWAVGDFGYNSPSQVLKDFYYFLEAPRSWIHAPIPALEGAGAIE